MSFFDELRTLVRRTDREVGQLKEEVLQPPNRRNVQPEQKTLILTQTLKELKELQKNAKAKKQELGQGQKFVEIMSIAKVLMDKNVESLQRIEDYIQQYGYQPLPKATEEMHSEEERATPSPKADTEKGNNGDIKTDVATTEEPSRVNSTPPPAAKHPTSAPVFDPTKTPTLEDFGLSEETMHRNMFIARSTSKPAMGISSIAATNVASSVPYTPSGWNPNHNVPSQFCHSGISVTPGLMASAVPYGAPQHYKYPSEENPATPEVVSTGRKLHKPLTTDQLFLNSPVPPVLCTPGAKLFTNKPTNVGDAGTQVTKLDLDAASPEPPILKTPGKKSLRKGGGEGMAELSDPERPELLAQLGQDLDTPEPPELTSTNFKNFMSTVTPSHLQYSSDSTSSKPVTNQLKCSLPASITTSTWHGAVTSADTPEPPELTTNFAGSFNKLKISDQKSVKSYSDSLPVYPDNASKNASSFQAPLPIPETVYNPVESSGTPEMPELTTKLNFTSSFATEEQKKSKTPRMLFQDTKVDSGTPTMPELTGILPLDPKLTGITNEDKENQKPQKGSGRTMQNLNNNNHVVQDKKFVGIPAMSLAEYSQLYDYMQNMLPFDLLTEVLPKFNVIIMDRCSASPDKKPYISESEIRDELGTRTKVFVLAMTTTGRFHKAKDPATGGAIYVLNV